MTWLMEILATVLTAFIVVLATGIGAAWAIVYNKMAKSLMWNKGVVSEDDLAKGVSISEQDMPQEDSTEDEDWYLPELRPHQHNLVAPQAGHPVAERLSFRTLANGGPAIAKSRC